MYESWVNGDQTELKQLFVVKLYYVWDDVRVVRADSVTAVLKINIMSAPIRLHVTFIYPLPR